MTKQVTFFLKAKRWLVRSDSGHFLAKNNRWYKSVACATDIKLYKTSGHAQRALKIYGAPPVSDGHFESRGSVIAVYENDVIDRCGRILRAGLDIEFPCTGGS